MKNTDTRQDAARFYDMSPPPFDDVPFYQERISSMDMSVLELGCGTGRVLIALTDWCAYIHGIDDSQGMIDVCKRKMEKVGISSVRAAVEVGDITKFDLARKFDLIIAPYRVFQNLETDVQVDGFFDCVKKHLASKGSCILNVFHPWAMDKIQKGWGSDEEHFFWQKHVDGGSIICHVRRKHIDTDLLVLYPEITYRRYEGNKLVDKAVLNICMRCYYPEQFEKLVTDHGFQISGCWGGYQGEPYGEGNELLLEFGDNV